MTTAHVSISAIQYLGADHAYESPKKVKIKPETYIRTPSKDYVSLFSL
jgi:hypothetical protein